MLRALIPVQDLLPPAARAAAVWAGQWASGKPDAHAEETMRIALWESIRGHDLEQTADVLRTRLVICTLYASVTTAPDCHDTLDYFSEAYFASGLPMHAFQESWASA